MNQQPDPKIFAAQLRKPEGEFGLKVAEMLNNTNRYITSFAYDCLIPESGQKILEIGFGNGRLMPQLLSKAGDLTLIGIDFSEDMVKQGKEILNPWIEKGNIQLYTASVSEIPFEDNFFDSICTINTLYFWPNPLENAKEALRVIVPGGKICIGIRPKDEVEKLPFTQYGFTLYNKNEAIALLENAGFINVHIKTQVDPPIEFNGEMKALESWVVTGFKSKK
jgi:ubiquinone/menaquinone biosynthesis C-methylase UbiE